MRRWPAYAAAAWSFVFAATSFYWDPWWLLGGTLFLLAAREASAGFAAR